MQPNTLAPQARVPSSCPRCGKPLTDPAGIGWCQECGYCRSLEEDKAKVRLEPASASPAGAVQPPAAPEGSKLGPAWVWILLLGVIAFTAVSQVPARNLAPRSFERALWTTGQIGFGVLMILVGQFIALLRIAPHDEKLGFKDMFLPFHLWSQVCKRLPALSGSLCLASWGLATILSACIFIGGLSHWMTYLPGQKNHPGQQSRKTV
jgi:hypothetical protein